MLIQIQENQKSLHWFLGGQNGSNLLVHGSLKSVTSQEWIYELS